LIRTELELPRRSPGGLNLVRRYFSRPEGQGLLPANPLFAECAGARNPRSATAPYPCVDDVVFDQVAAHMLPRAVGYARGVLEYFFRSKLEVERVSWRGGASPGVFMDVTNAGDEELEGTFELYARYDAGNPAERRQRVGVAGSEVVSIAPGATATIPLTLEPGWRSTASVILVFRGRLGREEGAVAGQIFSVPSVLVLQEGADSVLRRECSTLMLPDGGQSIAQPRFPGIAATHAVTCRFVPVDRRVTGTIHANAVPSGESARLPQIRSVRAFWQPTFAGAARAVPLTLDGVTYPLGTWTRAGDEPDPTAFELHSRDAFQDRSEMFLSVTLTSGETVLTGLVEFGVTSAVHNKTLEARRDPAQNSFFYLVRSHRSAEVGVALNHLFSSRPRFEAASIAGVPHPTWKVQTKAWGSASFVEGLRIENAAAENRTFMNETVFDDFAEYSLWAGEWEEATQHYDSIVPIVSPNPAGPRWTWEASVRRLYDAGQLAFLETFVLEDVDDHRIAVIGREP
jgi:hypothetical protein